jgi:hypothetical protein
VDKQQYNAEMSFDKIWLKTCTLEKAASWPPKKIGATAMAEPGKKLYYIPYNN